MKHAGAEPFPTISVDSKEEDKKWDVAAKAQMKKITKIWQADMRKAEKAKAKEVRIYLIPLISKTQPFFDPICAHRSRWKSDSINSYVPTCYQHSRTLQYTYPLPKETSDFVDCFLISWLRPKVPKSDVYKCFRYSSLETSQVFMELSKFLLENVQNFFDS